MRSSGQHICMQRSMSAIVRCTSAGLICRSAVVIGTVLCSSDCRHCIWGSHALLLLLCCDLDALLKNLLRRVDAWRVHNNVMWAGNERRGPLYHETLCMLAVEGLCTPGAPLKRPCSHTHG